MQSTPPSSGTMGTSPTMQTAPTTTQPMTAPNSQTTTPGATSSGSTNGATTVTPGSSSYAPTSQAGAQANVQQSTSQTNYVAAVPNETQVTTVVQQLDTEGPAVVQRITTEVGGVACSPDTVESLVDALHNGSAVTITTEVNGQPESATFTPTGPRLGYGEAYIALGLAAEELRDAGITSCATPQEWQAVLDGGPITVTTTGVAVAQPRQFPGILNLRAQGQGWGQIAQSGNVQLGQVLSGAAGPSPTGYSSSQFYHGPQNTNANGEQKGHRKYWLFGPRQNQPNESNPPANTHPTNPPPATTPPNP